jgi:hypothetical protein
MAHANHPSAWTLTRMGSEGYHRRWMGTSLPRMIWATLAVGCAVAGCSASRESGDADVTPQCSGAKPVCCEHTCDNDVLHEPSCVSDAWVCPPDTVSSTYCPTHRFCQGPLPGVFDGGTGCDNNPGFTCCVGQCSNHMTTSPFCDAGGWHCPTGSVSPTDCPGQSFCLGQ